MHKLFRFTLACFTLCAGLMLAAAQEGGGNAPLPTPAPQSNEPARTEADETFDLNITERRITKRDFEASTSVEAGEERARGLRLKIGVAVGAEEIDVLLRNVRGQVRFRASLERILERLNARRTSTPSP